MIKIEHPDLDKIAKDYFDKIKTEVKNRNRFMLLVFNVIFNGTNRTQLNNYIGIPWQTKIAIVNFFLRRNKLSGQSHYNRAIRRNLSNWVTPKLAQFRAILTYLDNDQNLERLILCTPDNALTVEENIITTLNLPDPLDDDLKKFINKVIDYSLFGNYAYEIAKELNVNTCPYCNRNYINTVIDKKGNQIIRPTFDHFFPQSKHPFLALSFYNLVPSCYYCNSSTKNAATISINTHIHPYKEGFDKDATFHILISNLKPNKSDPENYTLFFADNMIPLSPNDRYRKIFGGIRGVETPSEGNINLFKLKDIYQSHLDIVGELVVKCDKLSSSYAKSLQPLFSSLGTSREEFYQYYFGNYFNEKNFHRRPMAKLTKDVVSQIIPNFVK